MLKKVYRHNPNMVFREIAGELVLVPIRRNAEETDSIFLLNETGAMLWKLIDGTSSLDDVITGMLDEFETDRETISRDVMPYIRDMISSGALEEV